MSDTPRTDANIFFCDKLAGVTIQAVGSDFARQLERELADVTAALAITHRSADDQMFQKREAIKERDENKAGWDNASLVALRLEHERNEARECLREAVSHADSFHEAYPIEQVERWRKAAGLEPA